MGYQIGIINSTGRQVSRYYGWGTDSWVYGTLASTVFCLGAALGASLSGKYSNYYGRRGGIIANNIGLVTVSGLVIYKKILIPNGIVFVILRFFIGIFTGISSAIPPIYINEISPQKIKSWLGLFIQFQISLGILISFIIGYVSYFYLENYWSWAFPFLFPVVFSLAQVYFLLYYFQCDTPKWLLMNLRQNEAEAVLKKIYTSCAWQSKLIELEAERATIKAAAEALPGILTKSFTRQLSLAYFLCVLQQLTGINMIMFYSRDLFLEYDQPLNVSYLMTVAIGGVNFVSVIPCFFLIKTLGTKNMLLQGIAGLFVCYSSIVIIGYIDRSSLKYWLEIGVIFVSIGFYETSLGSLVWIYITEVVSFEWIGSAIGVQWVFAAVVSLVYKILFEYEVIKDVLILYIIFAVCCLFGFGIVYVFTVDTRFITKEEIVRRVNTRNLLLSIHDS